MPVKNLVEMSLNVWNVKTLTVFDNFYCFNFWLLNLRRFYFFSFFWWLNIFL